MNIPNNYTTAIAIIACCCALYLVQDVAKHWLTLAYEHVD